VFDLGRGQWNIPALRELLQHVLPERQNFDGFTVEHDFPVIGRKRIVLSGERIGSEHTDVGVILLVMRDVTHVET